MINVLNIVDSLGTGGTEKVLINIISNTHKKVNHTIMIKNNDKNIYKEFLEKLNIQVIQAPPFSNYLKHYNFVKNYLKDNKETIDLIHYYGGSLNYYLPIRLANKINIPVLIHSHNSQAANKRLTNSHLLIRNFHNKYGKSYNIACSDEAGKWMFGNGEYDVVINGVDINFYEEGSKQGNEIRKNIFPSNSIVLGNFGRFNRQKNQKYLINFLSSIHKKGYDNYYLLLIGEGELESELKNLVHNLNLENFVKIIGFQKNIEEYYGTIDAFFMSSIFEGLPLVLIEAQSVGVPILVSDNVDKTIKINNNIDFFGLEDQFDETFNKLKNILSQGNQKSILYGGQFDVKVMSKKILDLYLKILKEDSSNI